MKIFLFCGLLLIASTLRAQQPGVDCAPVQGQGWTGCAPLNSSQQPAQGQQLQTPQPPPQKWADHWGAIAVYAPSGSLGTSTNMPTQEDAESAALADCQSKHGSTCKIQLSYRNQCAALVVSAKSYNTNPGATEKEAIQKGMEICDNAKDPNCHPAYAACSLPQRIQ